MKPFLFILAFSFLSLSAHTQCENLAEHEGSANKISNQHRENQIEQIGLIDGSIEDDAFYYNNFGVPEFSNGFARAFWIGGLDPVGNLKLSAKQYAAGEDFIPGPIDDNFTFEVDPETCAYYSRVWIITAPEIINFKESHTSGNLQIEDIPQDILEWPGQGNPHMGDFAPQSSLAPFLDKNNDGIYDPLDGDYPVCLSEAPEFLPYAFNFSVYNDLSMHLETGCDFIGVEIRQINYLVNCPDDNASNHTLFTRATFAYKGNADLRDARISIWEDFDLGCYEQDLIGCDTTENINFVYNRDGIDSQTCPNDILNVPTTGSAIRSTIFLNSDLESFIYHANPGVGNPPITITDPSFCTEYYQAMLGNWRDGSPITIGGNGNNPGGGEPTKYAFSGSPLDPIGWSMQAIDFPEGDYRMLSTFYEGDIVPGQVMSFDFADYVLYDDEVSGLDLFNILPVKTQEIRSEYSTFSTTVPGCQNGLVECEFECVWPGDTNSDQAVTGLDYILAGAFAGQNFTGPQREVPSNYWFPFEADEWSNSLNGFNGKHGDANGDGNTDALDIETVIQNFGLKNPESTFIDEPAGPLADLNIHLEYGPSQEDIDYSLDIAPLGRWVRMRFFLRYDTPGANVPIHGLTYDVKLDPKITGALTPFLSNPELDQDFSTLRFDNQENLILNENNTFTACWTQTDGIDLSGDMPLTVNLIFLLADNLTTQNKDGIENIDVELFNIKGINADGEFIDVGYVQDNLLVFNLPWDGTDATEELIQSNALFDIYPNPAKDQMNVTFDQAQSGTARLISIDGKIFKKQNFSQQADLIMNTTNIPEGMYYLKIMFEDGRYSSQKVVKVR